MRLCCVTIWCALVVLQFAACKTTAKTITSDAGNSSTAQNAQPQAETAATDTTATNQGRRTSEILSVLLHVKKAGNEVVWTVTGASLKSGRFKHNFANFAPDYLKAYFTDDAGIKLDSNYFEHPLKRRRESPGDNDQPTTTVVTAAEGAAYLRANNNTAITTLHIYGADNKLIVSFPLKEYLK